MAVFQIPLWTFVISFGNLRQISTFLDALDLHPPAKVFATVRLWSKYYETTGPVFLPAIVFPHLLFLPAKNVNKY